VASRKREREPIDGSSPLNAAYWYLRGIGEDEAAAVVAHVEAMLVHRDRDEARALLARVNTAIYSMLLPKRAGRRKTSEIAVVWRNMVGALESGHPTLALAIYAENAARIGGKALPRTAPDILERRLREQGRDVTDHKAMANAILRLGGISESKIKAASASERQRTSRARKGRSGAPTRPRTRQV
jgi:hypothetical protein